MMQRWNTDFDRAAKLRQIHATAPHFQFEPPDLARWTHRLPPERLFLSHVEYDAPAGPCCTSFKSTRFSLGDGQNTAERKMVRRLHDPVRLPVRPEPMGSEAPHSMDAGLGTAATVRGGLAVSSRGGADSQR